jgi:hypothetical protein
MKRNEMLEKMVFSMELHAGNDPAWLDQMPSVKAGAYDYANKILRDLEDSGMFYCPIEDCGEFQLRTPKGWDSWESEGEI